MKKYLVINEYFLPGQSEKSFTKTKVVKADSVDQALSRDAYESIVSKNDWEIAVQEGRLGQTTSAVYELVNGINELGDDNVKRLS